MKNTLLGLLLSLLFQCSVDRTIAPLTEAEQNSINLFQKLDRNSVVQLSPEGEPGELLWLALTFVDKESLEPLAYQAVHLYHASAAGEYQPTQAGDESTARLNGAACTDVAGRIFVRTILPGDYGSSPDNRHIHMTVAGARPEAYDIHFKQYTRFMGKRFMRGSDQHFLAELKLRREQALVAFLNIEVKQAVPNSECRLQ